MTYDYTQLIGDARNPPTLLASASFAGMAVIDADPYIPNGGGAQWFVNQNNLCVLLTPSNCELWIYLPVQLPLGPKLHHRRQKVHCLNLSRFVLPFLHVLLRVPATNSQGTGIHWQVSQATSLMNIQFFMSTDSNTAHQGKLYSLKVIHIRWRAYPWP